MSEDLHKDDEYFEKAYRQTKAEPSPAVWEKISAGLDNADAINYRRKFIAWKFIAYALVFLLSGTAIYFVFFSDRNSSVEKAVLTNEKVITDSNTTVFSSDVASDSITFQQDKKLIAGEQSFNNKQHIKEANTKAYLFTQQLPQVGSSDFRNPDLSPVDQPASLQDQPLTTNLIDKDSSAIAHANTEQLNDIHDPVIDPIRQSLITNNKEKDQQLSPNKTLAKSQAHKNFKSYFTITPYASVDYTRYELDDDDHDPNNTTDEKQDIEGREMHQVSYSAGVLGKWQFSPKFSLKTGLVYSNIAIAIRPQTLYAAAEGNQRTGYKFITSAGYAFVNPVFSSSPAVGDSITATMAHHHLQYLNIPLMAGYKISAGKRFSVTPGVGLNASILLSTKVRTEVNEDTDTEMVVINKLQGLQKTYYSFAADVECNYTLNKHIMLTVLPTFKYALISITKNNVVRTYPYSIGLGAGITYRF